MAAHDRRHQTDGEPRDDRRGREPEPAPGALEAGPMSPGRVLALQRSAGNQAVGRLMREEAGEDATLNMVIPDSAFPQDLPPGTVVASDAAGPAADTEQAAPLARQLQRAVRARLQRKEDDTLDQCPRYWRYETPRDVATYNCAGLAWRTYDYRGDLAAERSAVAAGSAPAGKPGEVKHWFWEYDLHLETPSGLKSPTSHDFHTVAGVVDKSGADPDDVYSKNGARPVYGPGTGPGFKPPARDRATSNDPSETPAKAPNGEPLYKVRSNFKEIVKSHPCGSP